METYAEATVGKLAVGIRVVMHDGSRLDLRSAFVRNILRPVDDRAAAVDAASPADRAHPLTGLSVPA